jgi:hypothetical protein
LQIAGGMPVRRWFGVVAASAVVSIGWVGASALAGADPSALVGEAHAGGPPTLPAAPRDWTEVPDPHPPREAAFVVPRVAGDPRDAEVVVFFFGAGQGGGVDANVTRWKTMFEADGGGEAPAKVTTRTQGRAKLTIVDVRGTYLYRARPVDTSIAPEKRPGHRMIGVVVEIDGGPYFVRFVGPAKTVEKQRKAFERWLAGLR